MKNKVTIQLLGGLGNTLFQSATAYAYSLKHNKELVLIKEKIGTTHGTLESYENNIFSKIKFTNKSDFDINEYKVYNEPSFSFQEIPYIEGNVLLRGYYQSDKYFKDYRKEIIELFSYPEEYKKTIVEKYKNVLKHNTCSIHLRRGDYANYPDQYPVQNLNYYMKAIKLMPEDSVFVCFSDDIDFLKNLLPNIPEKFIFIENTSDYEDMLLMSLTENNVIANSSFSWWSGWLNNNQGKKIIIPSKWFGKDMNGKYDAKDLYCENWIKI